MNHSAARQTSLSITNSQSFPKLMSIESVMPSSHLIHCRPLSSCPQSLQASGLFLWVNSSHEVAKVLEFQLQHQSFQWTPRTDLLYDGLVGSPWCPRDSQESSPTPQFKSINFLELSFLLSVNSKLLIYLSPTPCYCFLCLWVYFCFVNKLIYVIFFRFHM